MFQFLMQVLILVLLLLLLGSVIGSLLGLLGNYYHAFELLSHFRVTFLVLQLFTVLSLIFFKASRKWAFVGLILSVPAIVSVWPYYFLKHSNESHAPGVLKLLNLNVLKSNHEYARVTLMLEREKPDIIALQEPNAEWFAALSPALKKYPYRMEIPKENNFGIALYSKIPLKNIEVKYFAGISECPSILAEATWQGKTFHLLTTHPFPPLSGVLIRNRQLQALAHERSHLGDSLIVMGDLNTSQWSYYFQKLLMKTHLKDTQVAYGAQLSWPAYSQWIKIPIDHVLVSQDWQVLNRRLGPDVGSDHLPVIVDLAH